jgi:hypothetical protein
MHWIWHLAILTERREIQQVNELIDLIERKASGEDFSEDRLYELDLELNLLLRQRLRDELSATELDELIERKASGEHFSEDRLYELDLNLELEFLLRQRRCEVLRATATEREGKTNVDDVRLYKFDLVKRQDLTPDEDRLYELELDLLRRQRRV